MIKKSGADPECFIIEENGVDHGDCLFPLTGKTASTVEFCIQTTPIRVDFRYSDRKIGRIALHQVPAVCSETVLHLRHEAGWTKEVNAFVAPKEKAHQLVKPNEVVNMGMGNEHMADPENLSRRKGADLPQVKEQRSPLKEKIHIERRILEGVVDQSGMELRCHRSPVTGIINKYLPMPQVYRRREMQSKHRHNNSSQVFTLFSRSLLLLQWPKPKKPVYKQQLFL